MATVHDFPDSMERAWREFAEALRAELGRADGITSPEVEHAVLAVKPAYLNATKPKPITFDPNDREAAVNDLNAWFFQVTHLLLLELAIREVMLVRLRGDRRTLS